MASAEDTADERPPGRAGVAGANRETLPEAGALGVGNAFAPAGGASGGDPDRGERIGFIGKRLGRFLITGELGRGGMATVYRARDSQVGRDVAVKVMHGFFAGRAEIEARFRREANAVAAIRHPSILALYDFSPPAGEEPGYIVSELIQGPGLRQLAAARGGRLLPEVAALIAARVADALGAAHVAGIVHRDVKPDNVLIDTAGGGARVVLTDFGVAHVGGMDTMTATGAVVGSPAYMSPEQARGEDVGPTSDVFSLGVLMYQLCTGHLPFPGKDPLSLITALLRGDYVRPAKLEARLGPAWEGVITRCLAREPAGRFSDGNAVAAALRTMLESVGLTDEQTALRRYLADADEFEEEISPGIARAAVVAAEQARRRGQIPRALAEVGRALAYAPEDAAGGALLARLGSRRWSLWTRTLIAGGAIVAVIGAAVVLRPTRLEPSLSAPYEPPPLALASATVAIPAPADRATSAPGDRAPTAAAVGHSPTIEGGRLEKGRRQRERTRTDAAAGKRSARKERSLPVVVVNPGIPEREKVVGAIAAQFVQPESVEGTGSEKAAPTPAAIPPAALAQTASVVLRASHGFCEPSLDGHPPSLRASYNNLAPGPHEIFCTLPQGGGKIRVATYDLRPGTRPSLTIVPGPNGRPMLGRPE